MYTPIIGTLGYVLSPDRGRVLLIHKRRGQHEGKYNGLGGKLVSGEDVVAGMVREIREEAGIEVTSLRLRGTISWPGFGAGGEDWLGFIFVVDAFTGEPTASDEGDLEWVDVDRLGDLPMWEGDRHFLPLLIDDSVGQFHGVMPYSGGRPVSWTVSVLPVGP